MVINTNTAAINSARLLGISSSQLSKSLARLSSGSRIVSPDDDSAGLAQSIKFDSQIHRGDAALVNLSNAASFSQTQDGYLQKTQKALDRMSELAMLALDKTKTETDHSNYDSEFQMLLTFITNDVAVKQFNGVNLFGATGLDVTTDSDATAFTMTGIDFEQISLALDPTFFPTLLVGDDVVLEQSNALIALNTLKNDLIPKVAELRAIVGANLTRLNGTIDALTVQNENLAQANSRLKDVDVAEEATDFARSNILVQSGSAMLAQANLVPQSALRLPWLILKTAVNLNR